jgi:hypothetical protein
VGWTNSGGSPVLAAGEGHGGDLGASGAQFGRLAGSVVAPASGSPAAREGRPPRLPASAKAARSAG